MYDYQKEFLPYYGKNVVIIRKKGKKMSGTLLYPENSNKGKHSISRGHSVFILTKRERILRLSIDNIDKIVVIEAK